MNGLAWSRRDFLQKAGTWAGAGILQPVLGLVDAGKSIAAAYPEELLSIEKFTKGKIKPGMIISKESAELVKEISPEGLFLDLQRGAEIKIAEATMAPDAIIAPYWVQATLRNQGKAVLDNKGQLWSNDGQPWIGGDPFPEPKSGIEAMWNHKSNLTRYDDVREIASEKNIDRRGCKRGPPLWWPSRLWDGWLKSRNRSFRRIKTSTTGRCSRFLSLLTSMASPH